MAQDRTVSGKVTSKEDGTALPGVSVSVKGTTKGVLTNAEGNYKISVSGDATLSFSFIGMASKSVKVGSQTKIDVSMVEADNSLNEVVVTALGVKQEKKAMRNAASHYILISVN